jgi:hypothetical protein
MSKIWNDRGMENEKGSMMAAVTGRLQTTIPHHNRSTSGTLRTCPATETARRRQAPGSKTAVMSVLGYGLPFRDGMGCMIE